MEVKQPSIVVVSPPNIVGAIFEIQGTQPYLQLRFSTKTQNIMVEKQMIGGTAKSKKAARTARDFDSDYEGAMFRGANGERGIPAAAFRNALISACRLVDFKMTIAKMSVFVKSDFLDEADGTPMVLIHGEPEKRLDHVKNATGVADIRCRAMWRTWNAALNVEFDADQFRPADVTNLLIRAGMQVGVGEGRNDSKKSCGIGCGSFSVNLDGLNFEPVKIGVA